MEKIDRVKQMRESIDSMHYAIRCLSGKTGNKRVIDVMVKNILLMRDIIHEMERDKPLVINLDEESCDDQTTSR